VLSSHPRSSAIALSSSDVGKLTLSELGLDSLDTVEAIVEIERQFEIEIPDEVADNMKTVGDVVDYVHAKPNAKLA